MSHAATNWAIQQRGLKPATKIVLWHLADCHNPSHGCFPSQEYLAECCEMSRSSLNEHLATLESTGLIRREQRRDKRTRRQESTRYRLAFETDFGSDPSPETGHGSGEAVSGKPGEPCPEKGESRVQNPDTNPVREPVNEPSERAEARERECEIEDQDSGDTPGTAAFEKRVMRFCNGTKFAAGPWPDWDTSSPGWIGRQFGKLDAAERMEAERWRDAYLLDMRQRGKSPVTVGIFLRDKLWTGLDPAILARADRVKAGRPVEEAKPDGWAKCLGPVGMAFLFGKMLDGPADADLAARPFLSDAMLREAWPAVWWWQASQRQKGGGVFADAWHGLRDQMVPVPADSGAMAEWKAEFTRRGWRWLAALDGLDVVYCPKGGPAGLSAFEAAVSEAKGDDSGEREAAE